jgi:hypothetical protein
MNPMALYDALNCASTSLIAAEGGQSGIAEQAFLEAAYAAPGAFPPGPLADALNLILGAVGDFAREVPA